MGNTRAWPPRHTLPLSLANRLRNVRLQRGLGLREAARLFGISPGYLCLLEQGKRCPSLAVAQDLVDGLRPSEDIRVELLSAAQRNAGRSYGGPQAAESA